jgi:capsular polysaccharide transport system permease protein
LLLINPLAHGVSAVRLGFSSAYHTMPALDLLGYLYGFAVISIFFGLALQVRFALRVATR